MRSKAVRTKLIDDASMVISLHYIVRMLNFGTYIQCSCGAFVRTEDWNRHIAEIIVDRGEIIENNIEIIVTSEPSWRVVRIIDGRHETVEYDSETEES